ncbi:MAG: radical SAM protein [Syntrophobacteraceae bacterium]|nr:radical SAM protein [Syntrophobacteraceae bacterium]
MKCTICERRCDIEENGIGGCGMYTVRDAQLRERYPDRYLAAIGAAIEAMPMVHYHPRGKFLQVCTVGCNFSCQGCVSEVLTHHLSAIEGAFQEMTPEQVVQKALAEECLGIMFCFNEPTVSYFTFRRLARMAKEKGLLAGCSTNAYLTESALEDLLPFLDFVNVGVKGASEKAYRTCGITDVAPILRNLTTLHRSGIYIEVSAIYRKEGDEDIVELARFVASLSKDIVFQVMRFVPFGDATVAMEPTVFEAESVCRKLRQHLDYVYLFNTPGTDDLNSRCPECGAKIIERGFFGPMCSNLFRHTPDARCDCGFKLPIYGEIHDARIEESGYFGGYRTVAALNMIRSILFLLGVTEKADIDAVLVKVLKEDFIKELYNRLNRMESYFDTVDHFAALTGRKTRGSEFRRYVQSRVAQVEEKVQGLEKPAVYYSLGHPLIAMFEDKLESQLVETAGGALVNRMIDREKRPGITISNEQFCKLAPEIIIVYGFSAWPVEDFIGYCTGNGLDVPAVRTQRIFHLHPYRSSASPDWILGLLRLANILHPEAFHFDMQKEADDFYRTFYDMSFETGALRGVLGPHARPSQRTGSAPCRDQK